MAGVREALVVAVGQFDDGNLSRLRSPAADAVALAEVLADPGIGGFAVRRLVDEPQRVIARGLEQFFAHRARGDLLVCYISSHGVKDDDGRLYFATTDTEKDWLASTAVPASYLQDLMDRCRARSVVLLLDCCYSGAFVPGTKGDRGVHLKDALQGFGRAILTASNDIEYAWEGSTLTGSGSPSVFTATIVEGLRTGAADRDGDGLVSVDDLGTYVHEQVRMSGVAQTPMRWSFGVANQVYLARARTTSGGAPPSAGGPGVGGLGVGGLVQLLTDEAITPDGDIVETRVGGLPAAELTAFGRQVAEAGAGACRLAVERLRPAGPVAVPALLAMVDSMSTADSGAVVDALTGIGTTAALFGLAERDIEP